ncbi:Spherulation-specific family 4 [Penicillium verhagenii]|uniref:Spherulation-specific family 4 n=1 Tax=Penicillium verhagenii TaxID=1562060 RepID=UPI002544FC65|nr:Spherulation-specific family 4 [Penicillium verhagenii]KAJ5928795.1 Spherulation-specific family 4 [Penicillium verhagenii]
MRFTFVVGSALTMASVAFSAACAAPAAAPVTVTVTVSDETSTDVPAKLAHAHSHAHGHSHVPSSEVAPVVYATVWFTEWSTVYSTTFATVAAPSTFSTLVSSSTFATVDAPSTISTVDSSTLSTEAPSVSTLTSISDFTSLSTSTSTSTVTSTSSLSTLSTSSSSTFSTVYSSAISASTASSSTVSSSAVSPTTVASSTSSSATSSSATSSAATASSTASPSTCILLPLYIWPTDNTTWGPVFEAASDNPDINFKVIVNPDSGPGDTTYPETEYITAIAQLNSYDNVVVLGYIPTEYATRAVSDVETDISTYSGWAAYTEKNITISGIFFDEAPRTDDTSLISYMTEVADNARSHSMNTIVFNPGTKLEEGAVNGYFDAADLIVEFENSYDTWVDAVPADEFSAVADYSKDAILLYSAPTDANYETVIAEAKEMGLGAAYLTNTDDYKSADTILKVTAALVQATS